MKIENLTDSELADIDNQIHSSNMIESINVGKIFAGKKFSVRGKKFFYFHDATQYARNLVLSERNKNRWRENQLKGIQNTQVNLEAQKLSAAAEKDFVGWQTKS